MGLQRFGLLLLIIEVTWAQEDSLRSALNAIDRRQKDLSEFSRYDDDRYGYSLDTPDDLAFLSPDYSTEFEKNPAIERVLMDYLEDYDANRDEEVKKRISSSFRERLEEDKERQLEELVENYLRNENEINDYRDIWDKYRNYPEMRTYQRKRNYYPKFGLDGVGLRKRKYYENEDPYLYDDDGDWLRNKHRERRVRYNQIKRFPVSKRSSGSEIHEHKRSTGKKDKTDPKVAKELSNIFGTTPKPVPKNKSEEVAESLPTSEKPIQVKKKSSNWSDYFGIDRRKKSEDELDKEWLIERFHKAVALKRNAEYPLQSFKNRDQATKKEDGADDVKISDIDTKLKNIEDTIVDDAIKFTGAHEDTTDPQEIQEVKDRLISRLAAAYSLEKMRQALGEYKSGVSRQREMLKQMKNRDQLEESKRVSVARKQAVEEKMPEGDNNIKCSQGDEECEEQNYRPPLEVLEQTTFGEECPKVQRACNEIASILGRYAQVFETACNMHQMCLLCSNNSWFAPTRKCNGLFLTKAFELCNGKEECQKEAQRSVKYLLDVNRSLRLEAMGECELACPDRR